jgi:hypothetical protein
MPCLRILFKRGLIVFRKLLLLVFYLKKENTPGSTRGVSILLIISSVHNGNAALTYASLICQFQDV